jgi:hypothetical protein
MHNIRTKLGHTLEHTVNNQKQMLLSQQAGKSKIPKGAAGASTDEEFVLSPCLHHHLHCLQPFQQKSSPQGQS